MILHVQKAVSSPVGHSKCSHATSLDPAKLRIHLFQAHDYLRMELFLRLEQVTLHCLARSLMDRPASFSVAAKNCAS